MFCRPIHHGGKLLLATCNKQVQHKLVDLRVDLLCTSALKSARYGPALGTIGDTPKRKNFKESILPLEWQRMAEKYPDFLPDPMNNSPLVVNRQIDDMLARRTVIEIPEFYVGSVLAVTTTDPYSTTKKSRFVGICIQRQGQLKYANFTLRNVIDGMGVEIRYDLYNPLLQSIEVLKLEKRLDDALLYLRDALPEYSTFPEDMKAQTTEDVNDQVPVNKMLVKMKPRPWGRHWERHLLKGVEKMENTALYFAEKVWAVENDPVYNYDLMLEYRRHCTEEQIYHICKRLADHERDVVLPRRLSKTKRLLRVAKYASPEQSAETASQTDKEKTNTD